MSEQTFVGTWEQISLHATRFHGQMLKLIVISNSSEAEEAAGINETDLRLRLASLMQEAENLELKPGAHNSNADEAAMGDIIADLFVVSPSQPLRLSPP